MKTDLATEIFRKWQTAGSPVPFDTTAQRGSRSYNAHVYNDDEGKLRLRIADTEKPMSVEFYVGKAKGSWELIEPEDGW